MLLVFRLNCLFCFLLCAFCVKAEKIQIIKYDTDDGLPSPEVYFAFQDIKGYKWFGTDRGLTRYDGYKFEVFNTNNSGITGNTIFKCFEAPNNNLWFVAYNGTISIFNQSKSTFEEFEFNDSLKKWFKYWPCNIYFEENVTRIMGTSDHYKYVAYDQHRRTIQKVYYNEMDVNTYRVEHKKSGQDAFYVQTEYKEDPIILTNCSNCLVKDEVNGKWLITNQVVINDTIYFSFSSSLYIVHNNALRLLQTFDGRINHLTKDFLGRVCVLTTNGFYIKTVNGFNHLLDGHNLTGMVFDHEGILWLSDLTQGVLRVPSIDYKLVYSDIIGNKIVTKIYPLSDALVLGVNTAEVFLVDDREKISLISAQKSNIAKPIRITNVYTSYGKTMATNSLEIKRIGGKYVATKIYSKTKSAMSVYLGADRYISVPYSSGYAIHSSEKNWELVSTNGERVTSIVLNENNGLYIATMKGLWYADLDSLTKPHKLNIWGKLSVRVNEVTITKEKHLVIATAHNGLWIMNSHYKKFHLSSLNGLTSDIINCIYAYRSNILIGTNKGITEISLDSNGIPSVLRTINKNDGLLSNYVYSIGVWRDKVWVGTDKGLATFPYQKTHLFKHGPYLNITRVFARKRTFESHKNVFTNIQSDVSVEFVGISSRKPISKFYKYRLIVNGVEKPYQYTNNNIVDFYGLKGGTYVFEVRCQNKDGFYSDTKFSSFVVEASILRTFWFQSIFLCLAIILIVSYIYWRVKGSKELESKESVLNELQFKFKESELALLRNQMNPHFIFNALNSIQSYIIQNDIETGTEYIKRFSDLMRSSLEYSRSEVITIESEVIYLEAYLKIEQLRFPERFKFFILIDRKIDNSFFIPPLLIQPIVENAVKHAFNNSTKDGKILVTFKAHKDDLICSVYDNGIGISKSLQRKRVSYHNSIGLKVVKERLSHLKNDSNKKAGFEYKDRSISSTNKSGTVVIITIPMETGL